MKELLFWCTGFLSSLFGGGSNKEEALEMYSRAANLFKMAKQWGQAGNTFCTIGRRGSGQATWLASLLGITIPLTSETSFVFDHIADSMKSRNKLFDLVTECCTGT